MSVIRHEIRAEELKAIGTVVGVYKALDHWAFSLCHYQDRLFFLTGGIKKVNWGIKSDQVEVFDMDCKLFFYCSPLRIGTEHHTSIALGGKLFIVNYDEKIQHCI